ncbi:MAG: hypothetical protein ACREM3_05635 [Candidatus Rokuibacteriota bacterium]
MTTVVALPGEGIGSAPDIAGKGTAALTPDQGGTAKTREPAQAVLAAYR